MLKSATLLLARDCRLVRLKSFYLEEVAAMAVAKSIREGSLAAAQQCLVVAPQEPPARVEAHSSGGC